MNKPGNAIRLRLGITDPMVLVFSHQSVMECDVDRVMNRSVRLLITTKKDVILYCQQACVVFECFDADRLNW
jgi:hypothetical protein